MWHHHVTSWCKYYATYVSSEQNESLYFNGIQMESETDRPVNGPGKWTLLICLLNIWLKGTYMDLVDYVDQLQSYQNSYETDYSYIYVHFIVYIQWL